MTRAADCLALVQNTTIPFAAHKMGRTHVANVSAASLPDRNAGTKSMERSFRKSGAHITPEDAERAWFASLLWRAFPEAHSENELAKMAAEVLTSEKQPVCSRAVRNWLRQENSPHFRYVLRVIALAGAESVFQILDPEQRP